MLRQVWQSAIVNNARRLDWLDAVRHPTRRDGAIAVALLVLPWVIALVLGLLGHLDATAVTILTSVSVGLPTVWLAWVPVRARSGTPNADPGPVVGSGAVTAVQLVRQPDVAGKPVLVEVLRYVGRVPRTDDQVQAALLADDGIRRTPSQAFRPDGRFLTIRISNNSDEPVYHVAISWKPGGESDPVGTLRPGKQVQRSRELPRLPGWMRSYERFCSAVVYFQDANGIRWRVMPDEPPEED